MNAHFILIYASHLKTKNEEDKGSKDEFISDFFKHIIFLCRRSL